MISLFGYEFSKKKNIKYRSVETPLDLTDPASWGQLLGTASSAITSEGSLKFSAVWSAVRILSEIPASLPKVVLQKEGDGWISNPKDPVADLLEYPNEYMTGFDFHELMNSSLQLRGNALAIIKTDNKGMPVQLIPINWSNVNVKFTKGNLMYEVNDEVYGIRNIFFASEVLHYKLFSADGMIGRSPISMAKQNIALALSAEQYGKDFFDKGGNHKAVIETANPFKSYTEYASWKERYDREHGGYGSNHGVPVLQPGMSYKQLTMSMEDAQFIATRQFSLNDISRWFNVPPHLLADLSRATFSNIEHQDLQFIKYSLRGVIKRQEKEWEMKLFSPEKRKTSGVKFNLDGLARGDMAARSTFIVNMVNAGVMTPNEGRAIENLQPIPGNDELRVPANIVGNTDKNI